MIYVSFSHIPMANSKCKGIETQLTAKELGIIIMPRKKRRNLLTGEHKYSLTQLMMLSKIYWRLFFGTKLLF